MRNHTIKRIQRKNSFRKFDDLKDPIQEEKSAEKLYKIDCEFIDFASLEEFINYIKKEINRWNKEGFNSLPIDKRDFPEICHMVCLEELRKKLQVKIDFQPNSHITLIRFKKNNHRPNHSRTFP